MQWFANLWFSFSRNTFFLFHQTNHIEITDFLKTRVPGENSHKQKEDMKIPHRKPSEPSRSDKSDMGHVAPQFEQTFWRRLAKLLCSAACTNTKQVDDYNKEK